MPMRKARRREMPADLSLTSLMDVMTIVLSFLLHSYSTDARPVAPSADLEVPLSTAGDPPEVAVTITVSKREILVDGAPLLALTPTPEPAKTASKAGSSSSVIAAFRFPWCATCCTPPGGRSLGKSGSSSTGRATEDHGVPRPLRRALPRIYGGRVPHDAGGPIEAVERGGFEDFR
jgi:hypothetical protein